jgi:chromosome segregation ATPase
MSTKNTSGFRFVPWRWSWKTFGLVFLVFLGMNYAVARYASRQPLFSRQTDDIDHLISSIQSTLRDQNEDFLTLRAKIEEIRINSENQRRAIQNMQKELEAVGGRLSRASEEAAALLNSNDQSSRAIEREEQTMAKIAADIADVRLRLQQVRVMLAQPAAKS